MKKFLAAALMTTFLAGCSMGQSRETVDVVQDSINGVVYIENHLTETEGGLGTGFFIKENHIITNHHVIVGGGTIYVFSHKSNQKYEARVVASDRVSDIAILEIVDWELFKTNEDYDILPVGDSNEMDLGEKVIIIGHPWGLKWTISEGIISAKKRKPNATPKFLDQVDANIFEGNSGGPVLNRSGEVVCISEIMLSGKGGSVGLCIPTSLFKKVYYDLTVLKEVQWRTAKISISLTDDGSAVKVGEVDASGPAARAGLEAGDIIETMTTSNGTFEVNDPADLQNQMAVLRGDDRQISVTINRNGETMTFVIITDMRTEKDFVQVLDEEEQKMQKQAQ